MLTKRYVYRSNALKERYIEREISYETYMSSLEIAKEEEMRTVTYSYMLPDKTQEIYSFEIQQLDYANKVIKQMEINRVNENARKAEMERIQKARVDEENRMKSLTLEEKLYEERERFYKEEVPKLIEEYKKESKKYRKIHDRLQWAIIIGSAVVTSTTSITIFTGLSFLSYSFKIGAAFCSLIVTIVAGF